MKKFREILSSGNKGFTLIELLVVIAVLGILAGIAVPRLTGVTDRAKKSEAIAALGSLKTALEIEELENGSYPTSIGAIAATYLDGITSSSATAAEWEGWNISYSEAPSGDNFTIDMTKDGLTALN
jgi:type II secretion system protein G